MDINAKLVKEQRTSKNWTQQHLADACGLSLRTIQRVERYGNASNDTVSALASVFEIEVSILVIPEVKVEAYEKEQTSVWVERLALMFSSAALGYIIAILTG